jgi:hypothetical protein
MTTELFGYELRLFGQGPPELGGAPVHWWLFMGVDKISDM